MDKCPDRWVSRDLNRIGGQKQEGWEGSDSKCGSQPPWWSPAIWVPGKILCNLSPQWLRRPIKHGSGYRLWILRLGHKRHCSFHPGLLDITAGEASHHDMRKLKQPCGEVWLKKNWGLQPTATTHLPATWRKATLKEDSPTPVKTSDGPDESLGHQ